MTTPGTHTLGEIQSQPEAWTAVLAAAREQAQAWQTFFSRHPASPFFFFGCGSTYYLSMTMASVLQTLTGRSARAVPSAELFLFPQGWIPADTRPCGVALSRSGTTTETLRAVDYLAQHYQAHLACVTCYYDTPLAANSAFSLVSPEGHEESVAQTRSFSSMLVGALALAGTVSSQSGLLNRLADLPSLAGRLMERHQAQVQALARDAGLVRVFFLGSGPRYGLACEAMLKLKEMSLTASEAFHFLEFRHGPKSMVDDQTLVVGLLSDSAREIELPVLREMKALGGRVMVLAESDAGLAGWADAVVPFASGLPELAALPLYLPLLQLFAFHRSVGKDLDPDSPRNLDAVVEL